MTNIPFPNPHDADALNNYLDDLAAGKQATPESDVEMAAQEFHQLASRAEVTSPKQSVESKRGEVTMHTAPLAAPISNRTRKQMQSAANPGRSYGWLSAVIVAGLMISMIGSAWLNREPGNPHDQLAFAPGTVEAIPGDEVLTPASAPWIADFDVNDCTGTSGLRQVEVNYQSMPKKDPQGYSVVKPADPESAVDAANQYRAMRACETFTDAWAYWSEARIYEHPRVLDDIAQGEVAELQQHFADVYPEQFMAVGSDLSVGADVEAEWAGRIEANQLGLPVPLDAKLNPEWGVELSDGRIAFPATIMYSSDDPAIVANGLPIETPSSTVAMIFTLEDGAWKYDDSLQLCVANCKSGIGNPTDMENPPNHFSAMSAECTMEQMTAGEFRERTAAIPRHSDRSYQPIGTPSVPDTEEIVETFDQFAACSANMGEYTMYPIFTDLGMQSWIAQSGTGGAPNADLVPFLRDSDRSAVTIVTQTPQWHQIDVIDEPVHRGTANGMVVAPLWTGQSENRSLTKFVVNYVDPERAVLLDDGRVAVSTTIMLSSEDRGAIFYEGNMNMVPMPVVIFQEQDGAWLIDQVIAIPRHVDQASPSQFWWWDEQYDPAFTWTQPISFTECPDDATPNGSSPDNPGGTQYALEEYDDVSPDRSYEIVGSPDSEDAEAVVVRLRETYGCIAGGKTTLKVTARFEYENRTTAGRDSVETRADERTAAAESVSGWLESELGLTPTGMYVQQNPDELDLDGTEALINQGLYNPDNAVLFADGRIGVIPSVVSYSEFPMEVNAETVPGFSPNMSIFVYQDGEWMLDENLPVCIGDCSAVPMASPVGMDGDMPGEYWAETITGTPEG